VQVVRIDVSVLDDHRQPIRGLQESDFTVLEDGQTRPIQAFQAVDRARLNDESGSGTPPASSTGVVTNEATEAQRTGVSRLIVILMDRSIPTDRPLFVAKQVAGAAIDAMAPGDLAAIVSTGGGVPQNFTADRVRLHKVLEASDWSKELSWAQKDDPIVKLMGLADPLSSPSCMCGLCVMDTITHIAHDLQNVPRRKLLLFVGSNLIVQAGPRAPSADVGCEKRVRDSRERLFDALSSSGLTVHSIDPQGLASVGPQTRATVVNGIELRDSPDLRKDLTDERRDFMVAQGNLDVLPALTGGRTILNNNEPFRLVPDVLHESDAYYLLAFEPLESKGEVRHTIEVKVARKGAVVHTARLLAPSATPVAAASSASSSSVARALTDLLPDPSVPLKMAVATFAGADRRHAYVGITLDASAFGIGASIPLQIGVVATDERGQAVGGAQQTTTIKVPAAAVGTERRPVEVQTYVTLAPGDYELRAAILNSATQATGSVFTHITVPAFDGAELLLSDVVLGTGANSGSLPKAAPQIPIEPTTARVFTASPPVTAFFRIYRASATDAGPSASIDATVLDAAGAPVRHQSLQSATFTGQHADVRIGLPLQNLAPGAYVLRIDAKQGSAEASRTIAYTVAPTVVAASPKARSPELTAALDAVAAYVDQYEHRLSAITAEEDYAQAVVPTVQVTRPVNASAVTRKTRAYMYSVNPGQLGWVTFRDVFEVDGRPVRDREERLSRLLQTVTPDSLDQARKISAESARYNLIPDSSRLSRTLNVPQAALMYVRGANLSRSDFRLGKRDTIDGISCLAVQFTERSSPRLIGTADGAPAYGTVWIDDQGRVLKTDLRIDSDVARGQPVHAQIVVAYSHIEKLDLWLPTKMDETYMIAATGQMMSGHATYSDFHEYKVTTSEGIK
jgi:VWFA-related protein